MTDRLEDTEGVVKEQVEQTGGRVKCGQSGVKTEYVGNTWSQSLVHRHCSFQDDQTDLPLPSGEGVQMQLHGHVEKTD